MKHVKWIFVVLIISVLTSFIAKDKVSEGVGIGDVAPGFTVGNVSGEQAINLKSMRGKYVLLSFWASYDAPSRIRNANLSNAVKSVSHPVEMISVSFDEYKSVFTETIRKDRIDTPFCFVDTKGERSSLFKTYNLKRGFTNYLLDADGVIIARNISAEELPDYLER